MLWEMRQGDELLRLPGKDEQLRRWRLVVRDDGLTLSDWNLGQAVVGPVAALVLWLYAVGFVAWIGWMVYEEATASRHGYGVSGGLGWIVLVVLGVVSLLPGMLLMALMQALGVDRRSVVEVDRLGRRCVLRRWRWGWVMGRREAALGAVDWEVLPGTVRRGVAADKPLTLVQGLAQVVLIFGGPLGWLIAIIRALSIKNGSGGGQDIVEVVRLELREVAGPGLAPGASPEGLSVARVTLAEEETAEAFLAAWDAAKR